MRYKVVQTDHVYPDLDLEAASFGEIDAEFVCLNSTDEDVIVDGVRDADCIITAWAVITKRAMESAGDRLKSISKTGIGVNNIDVEAATAKGVKVLNVPDYCIEEVSDHAAALALSLLRFIPYLNSRVKGGDWSTGEAVKMERLHGKTLGLLGYGRIARLLHDKMKPWNVKTLAYDPFLSAEQIASGGAEKAEFDELLAASDIVSMHLPLTKDNEHMIDAEALSIMKPTAFLINCSRGPLVDERALADALRSGAIAGAGLDVVETDSYDADNPIFSCDNAIITPHIGFHSLQATQELREKVIADVLRVLAGEEPRNQVNR
ncbi:MAG: C-terminal binding protein [Clostridiales Family XIII bacterium]|jgi:D-3-phosphoglycerate dehydrogenase|nr:C-terminal binding protein [Clostridiales Family XIII bacterium]